MSYVKVKDKDHLVRNLESNAIINTDYENYQRYIETYKIKKNELNKIKTLENEVSTLKEDISEIKNLLQNIVNNKLL